jgi:hypothetical protein
LTAAEAAAVVLEDDADGVSVYSAWALVGKVLSPTILHISTISAALRPAWGNPRGLVLNPAGDNLFVAKFATKADKDRVVDGPPWVVGKRAVLLQDFNVDLKPRDMTFRSLKIWARIINLPFGYMHKRWGAKIAESLCIEGSVPVVDCDSTGRCWGSYMRVRVEVDVDKPLMRGVTIFSQRRNLNEWYEVQYEYLPHYCFACGFLGHSSLECKDPPAARRERWRARESVRRSPPPATPATASTPHAPAPTPGPAATPGRAPCPRHQVSPSAGLARGAWSQSLRGSSASRTMSRGWGFPLSLVAAARLLSRRRRAVPLG